MSGSGIFNNFNQLPADLQRVQTNLWLNRQNIEPVSADTISYLQENPEVIRGLQYEVDFSARLGNPPLNPNKTPPPSPSASDFDSEVFDDCEDSFNPQSHIQLFDMSDDEGYVPEEANIDDNENTTPYNDDPQYGPRSTRFEWTTN